jgi:sugar O-acyltransferase (sialic acid O-acetyltransferase NeuD family)
MKKKLVVWGTSGHALVVANIIKLVGEYEIVGFINDLNPDNKEREFCGVPILGGKEQLETLLRKGVNHIILGFGDCDARLSFSDLVTAMGFSLAKAIHPKAIIEAGVSIDAGTVIAAGAVVNPGTGVGKNVIINTCASVDHNCFIEDGAHICPGVTLGGSVSVGRVAWVGIGTTVKDHVRIGGGALIGAGSVVIHDIPDNVVAYGVPAKIIRRKS